MKEEEEFCQRTVITVLLLGLLAMEAVVFYEYGKAVGELKGVKEHSKLITNNKGEI